MTPQQLFKEIKCLEVKENPDGSADIIFEASESFKDMYMEAFELKEWSQEHFSQTIHEAIKSYTEYMKKNVKSDS